MWPVNRGPWVGEFRNDPSTSGNDTVFELLPSCKQRFFRCSVCFLVQNHLLLVADTHWMVSEPAPLHPFWTRWIDDCRGIVRIFVRTIHIKCNMRTSLTWCKANPAAQRLRTDRAHEHVEVA